MHIYFCFAFAPAQVSLGAVARAHSLALTRWADLIDTLDKGRTATPEFYAQLARFELELIYENVKYAAGMGWDGMRGSLAGCWELSREFGHVFCIALTS